MGFDELREDADGNVSKPKNGFENKLQVTSCFGYKRSEDLVATIETMEGMVSGGGYRGGETSRQQQSSDPLLERFERQAMRRRARHDRVVHLPPLGQMGRP